MLELWTLATFFRGYTKRGPRLTSFSNWSWLLSQQRVTNLAKNPCHPAGRGTGTGAFTKSGLGLGREGWLGGRRSPLCFVSFSSFPPEPKKPFPSSFFSWRTHVPHGTPAPTHPVGPFLAMPYLFLSDVSIVVALYCNQWTSYWTLWDRFWSCHGQIGMM